MTYRTDRGREREEVGVVGPRTSNRLPTRRVEGRRTGVFVRRHFNGPEVPVPDSES